MATETQITIQGNLTADPELRFTQNGTPVASFTIASTPRTFNKQTQQWDDGETLFMRCSAWRQLAENISETLRKGMPVIAHGKLQARSYKNKDGENRTSIELLAENVGPSLQWVTGTMRRAQTGGNRPAAAASGTQDPWAQTASQPAQTGQQTGGQQQPADPWAQTALDEQPPF